MLKLTKVLLLTSILSYSAQAGPASLRLTGATAKEIFESMGTETLHPNVKEAIVKNSVAAGGIHCENRAEKYTCILDLESYDRVEVIETPGQKLKIQISSQLPVSQNPEKFDPVARELLVFYMGDKVVRDENQRIITPVRAKAAHYECEQEFEAGKRQKFICRFSISNS